MTSAPNLGIVEWAAPHCPRQRWMQICVQLYRMQQDIAMAQRHTPGVPQHDR